MTENRHFKWSSEPQCICLYLGLNLCPLCSYVSVLPTRPQWQMSLCGYSGYALGTKLSPPGRGLNFYKQRLKNDGHIFSPLQNLKWYV